MRVQRTEILWNQKMVLFVVMLATKYTTVCTRFLLYGAQATCFTDSTNIDTSVWLGFLDPKTQRGGIQSVHTNVFLEAGEINYVNPLV